MNMCEYGGECVSEDAKSRGLCNECWKYKEYQDIQQERIEQMLEGEDDYIEEDYI